MTQIKRRRPAWLPVVAMLAILPVLLWLGNWQLQRAAEKQVMLDQFSTGGDALALTDYLDTDPLTMRYQRVQVTGHYLTDTQFLLDGMTKDGRPGLHVLTPLALEDGSIVMIDRGWIPETRTRDTMPDLTVAPATGPALLPSPSPAPAPELATAPATAPVPASVPASAPVPQDTTAGTSVSTTADDSMESRARTDAQRTVTGRVVPFPAAGLKLSSEPATGWPRRVVYPTHDEVAAQLQAKVYPHMVWLDASEPNGFERDWKPTDFGPARHIGYAVQWFALAITLILIYIILKFRRKRDPGND